MTKAKAAAYALWTFLWIAIVTVVVMTWHPWVIGARAGCPPGQVTAWDGHCHPS